jgi:hypothetical protein
VTLTPEQARALVEAVCRTCPDEMDCGCCFNSLAAFAQAELAGKDLDAALAAVRAHLENCVECCEEYEALRLALEALGE